MARKMKKTTTQTQVIESMEDTSPKQDKPSTPPQQAQYFMASHNLSPGVTSGHFGLVEKIGPDGIIGWVFNAESLGTPLVIHAYLGKYLIGKVLANLPRDDVATLLGRQVNPGFTMKWSEVKIPQEVDNLQDTQQLNIRFVVGTTNCLLGYKKSELPVAGKVVEWSNTDVKKRGCMGGGNLVEAPAIMANEIGAREKDNTLKGQGADAADQYPSNNIKYHIECAIPVSDGLVLIGWIDDRFVDIPKIYVSLPNGTIFEHPFKNNHEDVILVRTYRPDVIKVLEHNEADNALLGFVIWLPIAPKLLSKFGVAFDKRSKSATHVSISRLDGATSGLASLQIHSGFALRTVGEQLNDNSILLLLDEVDAELFLQQTNGKIAAIDNAFVLNGKAILINGWIAVEPDDLQQIEVVAGGESVDIKSKLVRIIRPDLFDAFPWSKSHPLGFIALIDSPELLGFSKLKLRVQARRAGRQLIEFSPGVANWPELSSFMNMNHVLAEPIDKLILASPAMQGLPNFNERMATLQRSNFLCRHQYLKTSVDNTATTIAAIDRVFPLGDDGLLIFGWHYEPKTKPQNITVRGPDGQICDVTESLFPLARFDLIEGYKTRFPDFPSSCGFVCHAPLPTKPGECRAMCFSFEEFDDVWLRLSTPKAESDGVQLVREILDLIPSPDKIRGSLYSLFDRALGTAIEAISAKSRKTVPQISERQFGTLPVAPTVSVIIPLYGRYDFLRHQLAHFVDDADFDDADLIYVVDDPSILVNVLDMAVAHYQLFCKPFRLVWYEKNLGFSGANNIGARVARADTLLLLNSDIIPKASGWLSILRQALDELPQAGAVGPLLQFADDSIQHAGMHPKRDAFFPGFMLNIHPGKGTTWSKGNEPTQHPMLTAACLLLRKADYDAVGGLDEGYIIGDFEDSDLCLKLRKLGQTLWLVPAAKLWHLERQSQNMGNISGYRQLLTLFNGWRYRQKILNGEIANPELSEA